MTLGGAAARGALITVGGQWVRFLVQLTSVAVLARLLSPADFGLFAMVVAITGFAAILSDFGLSMAAIQDQTITTAQRSNLFWINLAIGATLTATVWLLAEPIAFLYGRPEVAGIVQAVSFTFLIGSAAAQFRSEVSRRLRFYWLAAADLIAQLVALGVAITVAVSGGTYWALVAQQLVLAFVPLVVLAVGSRWLPSIPSRAPVREHLKFGANTLAVQLINYTSGNIGAVLIGRFEGASSAGYLNRANQLLLLPMQQIASPMTRVALPVLSRVSDPVRYQKYVERAQLVLGYLLVGVLSCSAVAADPLIEVAMGPGWDESKLIFRILAIGGVFQAFTYLYYWIFLSKAMTAIQLKFTLISRSIMIGLVVLGLPFGAPGVAAGVSAGLFVNWFVLTVFALKRTGVMVRPLMAVVARPALLYAAIAMAVTPVAVVAVNVKQPLLELIIILLAFAAVFGVSLVLPFVRRDLAAILSTISLIRRK